MPRRVMNRLVSSLAMSIERVERNLFMAIFCAVSSSVTFIRDYNMLMKCLRNTKPLGISNTLDVNTWI